MLFYSRCIVQDCPVLNPPDNGYFIRNDCNNVFNAACGIKCNPGFEIRGGDSIRLCQPDGNWSGVQPKCYPTQCVELETIENGQMTCTSPINEMYNTSLIMTGTECRFKCSLGFKLAGSALRTCLPISIWTGLTPICKPVKCPRLRRPNFGAIYPNNCNIQKSPFGGRCAFACNPGFTLQGPTLRECREDGTWSGGPQLTRCVGISWEM